MDFWVGSKNHRTTLPVRDSRTVQDTTPRFVWRCFYVLFCRNPQKFERKKTLGFLGNQPSFQCFLHGKQQKSSPIGELISHGDTSNSRPVHRTGQVPDWKLNKEFPVSIGKKTTKPFDMELDPTWFFSGQVPLSWHARGRCGGCFVHWWSKPRCVSYPLVNQQPWLG